MKAFIYKLNQGEIYIGSVSQGSIHALSFCLEIVGKNLKHLTEWGNFIQSKKWTC